MSFIKGPLPISFNNIYLNGRYTTPHSQDTLSLRNPKDGTLVANKIPIADGVDVDEAVRHAEAAFHGPWATFSSSQRSDCFRRLADLLETRLLDILHLDSLTTGNPVSLIPTRERNYIKNCLLYYAGWTDKYKGDYFPADDGFVKLVRHEPIGVCAAINPYNSPVASLFIKAAPCLAVGNVLIVKPSEKGPLGSLAVAPLFEEAGFPPGVLQVLPGDGRTGALLAEHMRVRKSANRAQDQFHWFGGYREEDTNRSGAEQSQKSHLGVGTVNGILARSGQVCVAASRVYVQRSISEKYISQYLAQMKAAALEMGDPQDPETKYGPLADTAAFERVREMISRGKEEAELVIGGPRMDNKGCFIEPTVFLNPKPEAEIYRNEVFGPVVVVKTFDTEDEVVAAANDTEYGLMAGVFTRDLKRALRVSGRIESGVVGINCVSMMSIQAPFGGKKESGIGREFGEYASIHRICSLTGSANNLAMQALRAFTEPKTILIKYMTSSEIANPSTMANGLT
ncbi:Retinal dehydrogenase 1 [Tolypocladium ophioglossoides CBS 100239]|uniref:aldehyde dehydrogenase (NAD(+)) n=1 Tax=Tolypocladium ophioglossoides (strain CBS 100239) TaxID=1163406 RepID=A0A0L0MZF2_TOLOC|nr:Retinal dehydrogenase 1 [Tolypocladium ophioglossoides CBS 100239]